MSRPLAVAKQLEIPIFLMFDADIDEDNVEKQKNDNECLLELSGNTEIDALPEENLFLENTIIWKTKIGDEIRNEYGSDQEWNEFYNQVKEKYDLHGIKQKNWYCISKMLEDLFEKGWHSELLDDAVDRILAFAGEINSVNN